MFKNWRGSREKKLRRQKEVRYNVLLSFEKNA